MSTFPTESSLAPLLGDCSQASLLHNLSMVPPFGTAHTFSVQVAMVRESRVSISGCLLKQRYFCAVYN